MKILVLGIGQSNFLNQLYREILQVKKEINISIDKYTDLSRGKVKSNALPYKAFHNFQSIPIPKSKFWITLFKFSQTNLFWKIFFFELSQKKSLQQIKNHLFDFTRAKYRVENHIDCLDFKIFHFHYCEPQNLKEIYFLPTNSKIICSFWGSDLMRATGVSNVFYVKMALDKTTTITIQTPELAEILYCKYGREFVHKMRILRFNLEIKIFNEIEKNRKNADSINNFKNRHSIPLDKVVVALGHNAFSENNHLLMLNHLKSLDRSVVEKLVFILHLGYGGDEQYIEVLKNIASKDQHLNIIVITEFFDEKDAALLRLSTDLLVQMPISDALSAAMTEVLYAGNSVITGAWLPYGFLRRNGIVFFEIEHFKELPKTIEQFLKIRKERNDNPRKIETLFFPQYTTPAWVEIFEDLID